MTNILREMLLIDDPSIFKLYQELIKISNYFIAPVFTISLILEFFGEMNFSESVKKLFLVVIFMGTFYNFHSSATAIALDSASKTLRKVSPTNLFIKKWTESKIKTKKQKGWDALKNILVPNLNDLIGTSFFVLAKIFIWLLKLIYSSVYHLTYVFAAFTAILYFLGWTKGALKGTVQASIWCMVMPFVIVAILALVGNSIEDSALNGDLVIAKIDTIVWLFGVTLLLLISPLITYGVIRGDGIHSFGSKMGTMVVSSGLKAMAFYPLLAVKLKSLTQGITKTGKNSFFEPPIKDLLHKNENSNTKKKLVENRGKLKSPFTKGRPLNERLKELGLSKEEAQSLSRISPKNLGKETPSREQSKIKDTGKISNKRVETSSNRKASGLSPKKLEMRQNPVKHGKNLSTRELLSLKRRAPKEYEKQIKLKMKGRLELRKDQKKLREKN